MFRFRTICTIAQDDSSGTGILAAGTEKFSLRIPGVQITDMSGKAPLYFFQRLHISQIE
jgi:hypothetical protein